MVFLWQQHDLYGVASWVDWAPRADEKVWMYDERIARGISELGSVALGAPSRPPRGGRAGKAGARTLP